MSGWLFLKLYDSILFIHLESLNHVLSQILIQQENNLYFTPHLEEAWKRTCAEYYNNIHPVVDMGGRGDGRQDNKSRKGHLGFIEHVGYYSIPHNSHRLLL